jgi:hypothetical protein
MFLDDENKGEFRSSSAISATTTNARDLVYE